MRSLDINLIPDRILYRNQIFLAKLVRTMFIILVGLLLAALLSLPVYYRLELQQQVNSLTNELDNISLQELNKAEDELTNRIQEKKEMEKMLKSVTGSDVRTTELISMVTTKMPAGIVTESIVYQPEFSELTVRAESTGREEIALFLKRLYNESLFTGVNVSDILGTGNRYSFSVIIKIGRKE